VIADEAADLEIQDSETLSPEQLNAQPTPVLRRRGTTRTHRHPALPLLALLGLVLLLAGSAYFPFHWDPPRIVHNQVTRGTDGTLQFGDMNNARTPGSPDWLQEVRTSGAMAVQLDVKPELSQTASIMMLSSNFWDTDFTIGQNGSTLLLWLRRPGSDQSGDPPFVVGGAFKPGQWTTVGMTLTPDNLSIRVGGITRLSAHIPADSTKVWSGGQIALGDEVHGGKPWHGSILRAQVLTPGRAVDYVSPGALSIPERYRYLPDHILPFPPTGLEGWSAVLLHLVSFVPVGFLIACARRPPMRPAPATVLGTVLAVSLAAGTFLFHGRHTAVAYIVVEAIGALLGAVLASKLARRQLQHPQRSLESFL
jgi:hypothetical protein